MEQDKPKEETIKITLTLRQALAISKGVGRVSRRKRFNAVGITSSVWDQILQKVKAVDLDQLNKEWTETAAINEHDPDRQMPAMEHVFICGRCKNQTIARGKQASGMRKRFKATGRLATEDNKDTFVDKWGVEHKKPKIGRSFTDTN